MPIISKDKVNEVNTSVEEMAKGIQELTEYLPGVLEVVKKVQESLQKLKAISAELVEPDFENNVNALADNNNQYTTLVTTVAESLQALMDSIQEAQ